MRVGFSYPHSKNLFGSDFGPHVHVSDSEWKKNNDLERSGKLSDIPLPPLFAKVDRNLANLKRMGISVVRWFILANGHTYGTPTLYPTYEASGLLTPKHIHGFTPPPVADKRFRRDFEELLKRFKAAQLIEPRSLPIQMIPCLIDFTFGSSLIVGTGPQPGTGWGGRHEVITDPAKR